MRPLVVRRNGRRFLFYRINMERVLQDEQDFYRMDRINSIL